MLDEELAIATWVSYSLPLTFRTDKSKIQRLKSPIG
jgi:hypothetical protein